MATLSTSSLNYLASEWEKLYKSAVLSGIVGDLAHKARGGYHISRQDQGSSNYSVTRADDRLGPNDRASAIDMTMSTADITKCHKRLREAWKNRNTDPRMRYINAWNGWDGQGDAGRYDVITGSISTATADHKWHIHLEIRRRYVNDMNAMKAILSILKGETVTQYQGETASPAKPSTPVKDDDMTKEEMLTLLKSPEARAALATAIWNTDNVVPAPGSPKPGKNPDGTDINTHWGAGTYLMNIYSAAVSARTYSNQTLTKDFVDENAVAGAIAANTAFVDALASKVAAALPPQVEVEPSELAEALKTALREGVAK